jgi:hypothetical protein
MEIKLLEDIDLKTAYSLQKLLALVAKDYDFLMKPTNGYGNGGNSRLIKLPKGITKEELVEDLVTLGIKHIKLELDGRKIFLTNTPWHDGWQERELA